MNTINNNKNTVEEKRTTIEVFDPKKFDHNQRWFQPINDFAFLGQASGMALAHDPIYRDSPWAETVPHPNFLRDVERKFPGYVLVYDDMGHGRDWILSIKGSISSNE